MLTSDPAFEPPHCPNPTCRHHGEPTGWKYQKQGTFTRLAAPHVIRRFRCRTCGRSFSTQTFDTTYWLKRPDLQPGIFAGLVACSCLRQLGRSMGVAGTTVQRQASRLGRHGMLWNETHRPPGTVAEPLVIDGLVSFEYGQYWPFETNVAIGAVSGHVYGATLSELRRSGRMTRAQKAKRARLEKRWGRPSPRATQVAIRDLIWLAAPMEQDLTIRSDEHRAYPRAIAELPHRIAHRTVSSRRCRTRGNPLQKVDHFDRMVRHAGSNHKRETIAFSKRRQGSMERIAVHVAWTNFIKRQLETDLSSPTPAMCLGLASHPLDVAEVLHRRIFPSLVEMPGPVAEAYYRRIPTRRIPHATRHALVFAA